MAKREKLLEKTKQLSLHDLPIGSYITDLDGRIIEANRYAREILQLPLEGQLDAFISDFYPDLETRQKPSPIDEVNAQDQASVAILKVRVAERELHLRDHSRRIRDEETGEHIGVLSCIEDITQEYSLQNKVEELTADIGSVLHTYSSTLVMIHQSASSILEGLKPDPFEENQLVPTETAISNLAAPATACVRSIRRLLDLSDQLGSEVLPAARWEDLQRFTQLLSDKSNIYPELVPPIFHEVAVELIAICHELKPTKLPRELIRQLQSDAREVVRIYNLITLHALQDVTVEVGHTVRALREFIVHERRVESSRSVREPSTLVTQAINGVKDFAFAREVQLRRKVEGTSVLVNVIERDVIRALANILHNAIKYSWARSEHGSWVLIHTYVKHAQLCFEVENYGVPIPKDEITEGFIFKLGFRGRLSSVRGRTGMGVGLADTLRVAREHGGTLVVRSQPAIAGRAEDDYDQPFLTTVTFTLPIYRGGTNEV